MCVNEYQQAFWHLSGISISHTQPNGLTAYQSLNRPRLRAVFASPEPTPRSRAKLAPQGPSLPRLSLYDVIKGTRLPSMSIHLARRPRRGLERSWEPREAHHVPTPINKTHTVYGNVGGMGDMMCL
jgi:hypothetical protein